MEIVNKILICKSFVTPVSYTYVCPSTYGEGDILLLVQIPLASASGLALASHFLVCTISCEPVVGLTKFSWLHNWDIKKN